MPKNITIKVNEIKKEGMKGKLYDNDLLDPRKSIAEGHLCDITTIKGETNIEPNNEIFLMKYGSLAQSII